MGSGLYRPLFRIQLTEHFTIDESPFALGRTVSVGCGDQSLRVQSRATPAILPKNLQMALNLAGDH